MTDKLFETTQSETLLSGTHFSPEFSDLRIRGKKKWIINEKCKKALENSIRKGLTVSVDANGSNSVGFSNGVVG
jgi:hypothetical protein